jgi:hypothetical protein
MALRDEYMMAVSLPGNAKYSAEFDPGVESMTAITCSEGISKKTNWSTTARPAIDMLPVVTVT